MLIVASLVVLSCVAMLNSSVRQAFHRAYLEVEIARARATADDPTVAMTRLTTPRGIVATIAWCLPTPPGDKERRHLALELIRAARNVGGDDAARGVGTAYFLMANAEQAAAAFESIPAYRRDGAAWNDIAAAELWVGTRDGHGDRLLTALDSVELALESEPALLEARFNYAKVVQTLAVIPVARAYWRAYIWQVPRSSWTIVAEASLESVPAADTDAWQAAIKSIDILPAKTLVSITNQYPQQARAYGEGPFLASWAEASLRGDVAAARQHLMHARIIGEALQRRSGETLLRDAVAAIDATANNHDLIAGHLAYRAGRIAYSRGDLATAEREMSSAATLLERGRSPLAHVASFYVASIMFDRNRIDDAFVSLQSLLKLERARWPEHRTFIARLLYEISLCAAVRGQWSDSLNAAAESAAAYTAVRERGNAAEAEAVSSEDYDFLGQADLARRHGVTALRTASESGEFRRARTILAALARTELREERWTRARAVINVERALATATAKEDLLDADMNLRLAAAESHLARRSAFVAAALLGARQSASKVSDAAARARLRADIDGVDGTIARRDNPRKAILLLSDAIAFQRRASRPIVLPELYLARGRAFVALGERDAAQADFDAGISEVESERGRAYDAELRPGMFDRAADLFQEALTLQLRRSSDPLKAFAYMERGRARTIRESIEKREVSRTPSVRNVQRHLAPGTVLVEYASLPDQLVIVVIDSTNVVLRTTPITRAAVARAASFSSRPLSTDTMHKCGDLFDYLVAPIRSELSGHRGITFVPDNTLRDVPFSALYDSNSSSFLVESYVVSTIPSAGVFMWVAEHQSPYTTTPKSVLIFANPAFSHDRFPALSPLYAAEREARRIAAKYSRASIYARDEATAERFLAVASLHTVIHFGGHSVIDLSEPANSALICAPSRKGVGTLTSKQIAEMHLPGTRLIVLAACSTVVGRNFSVEGTSNLATAFMIAGASAVLATLWDIEDDDTARLMNSVHEGIAKGISPAESLQQAQIKAIHSHDVGGRAPSRWAAFTLIGIIDTPAAPRKAARLRRQSETRRSVGVATPSRATETPQRFDPVPLKVCTCIFPRTQYVLPNAHSRGSRAFRGIVFSVTY